MELMIISDTSCLSPGEAPPLITKLHPRSKRRVGKSSSRLSGTCDNWRACSHRIKANVKVLSCQNCWKEIETCSLSHVLGLMFKDCNHFSQQSLVRIPELILHGCDSSCCVIAAMPQGGAWRASHWQWVLEQGFPSGAAWPSPVPWGTCATSLYWMKCLK